VKKTGKLFKLFCIFTLLLPSVNMATYTRTLTDFYMYS